MKVLIVDDNPYRHQHYRNKLDAEIDSAFSYLEACEKMRANEYGAIYLDHDLGDFHTADQVNGKELTGYDVVLWMIEHDVDCPMVVVHSANPVGARNMVLTLEQYFPRVIRDICSV